jgi:AraC-like DNA-binding protein
MVTAFSSSYYPPVDKQLLHIGYYLTTIGAHHFSLETTYPVEDHPKEYQFTWKKGRVLHDFALILIEQGGGVFEADGVPLTSVKAGQALWLVPGQWHRYQPDTAAGWTERWIGLNGFHLHQLRKSVILPGRSALVPAIAAAQFESVVLMQKGLLEEIGAAPNTNRVSWSAWALAILLRLFENISGPRFGDLSPPTADPMVNLALGHIRENCHRPLTVDWVAAQAQAGRRSLERHFAATGREPVAREILRARLERAEFLLSESPLPIKEIASACGFASHKRMIYSFHQRYGCSPGKLRK